tara:strand:+ start:9031 stop:9573 length:543 start_codon:yes stop_codon:yes gene_type:complete
MRIVIDGNIGSGKTTQLDLLEALNYPVKREPIDQWPLELFYSNKDRWGLTFQLIVLRTLKSLNTPCIYERCPLSSKEVFWRLMNKTPVEDEVYQHAYTLEGWGPDVYIYIDKDPHTCLKHISNRGQAGDSSVGLDLLINLDTQYTLMYHKVQCDKYKVDGSLTPTQVHRQIVEILKSHLE